MNKQKRPYADPTSKLRPPSTPFHLKGNAMNFEEFKNNVESWAEARGIYAHSTPEAQLLKAMSELGELADAQIKDDETEKSDAVIDTIVCLINYAHMSGIDLHKAMDDVWRIISQRTGRMVPGGAFVKEE